jgi:hypothetical protein
MFPDTYILSRRVAVMYRLPWIIPAVVVVKLTDQDLDDLDLAERTGRDEYWMTLNRIVMRLTATESRGKT